MSDEYWDSFYDEEYPEESYVNHDDDPWGDDWESPYCNCDEDCEACS